MFSRILVAVDDSAPALDAAKGAAELAAQLGAEMLLVTAVAQPMPIVLGDIAVADAEPPQETLARGDQLLSKIRAALPSSLPIEQRAVEGNPAEQIINVAREWKADLIVVGTHSRHGISRLLLGSTAEAIARRAQCSVLVVRSKTVVL